MKLALGLITTFCVVGLFIPPPQYDPVTIDAAAREHAEHFIAEHHMPLPESWAWGWHEFDGGQLRWGQTRQDEPRGTLILIQGWRGFIENYSPWIHQWHEAGFEVIAVDLPGQGASTDRLDDPEKPWSGDISLYGEEIAAFINARKADARAPVTLIGESFGAHITMRAIADGHLDPERLVFLVPGLEFFTPGLSPDLIHPIMSGLTRLGYGHRYAFTQSRWEPNWNVDAETYTCHVRESRTYMQAAFFTLYPEYRVGGITNEWAAGFESSGQELATSALLDGLDIPTLMILGSNDQIVRNDRPVKICDEKMTQCQRIELPNAGHCLLFEEDATVAPLMKAVIEFADQGQP